MKKNKKKASRATNYSDSKVMAIDEYSVIEWCPGDNAILPPQQVHILLRIPFFEQEVPGLMFAMRIKSRDAAERLIAALRKHTDGVWPVS